MFLFLIFKKAKMHANEKLKASSLLIILELNPFGYSSSIKPVLISPEINFSFLIIEDNKFKLF